ncbi:MAG: trypsin-like serine protease [Pseudomonadota bacterium]
MKVFSHLGIAAAAVLLSGCDAIRLPGMEETPQAAPETNPLPTQPVENADVVEPTEPISNEANEDENSEENNDSVEAFVPVEQPPSPENTVTQVISSLAELNARSCGLTRPEQETLTVAAMAGVDTVAEPRFGGATVNGLAASLASAPGIVKLEPRRLTSSGGVSSGHCGATRIAENWFITAAHCIDEDYDELRLVTGTETLSSPLAVPVSGTRAVCHAAYSGASGNYRNDIALIRVEPDTIETITQVPIAAYGATQKRLSPVTYPVAGMAGWGLTGFDQGLSNDLLAAELTITNAGPATINVASRNGAGPCIGDSGGPLYVAEEDGSKVVVGVLSVVEQNQSTGGFCEGEYGGRYTNLQGYTDWISDVISACDAGICE